MLWPNLYISPKETHVIELFQFLVPLVICNDIHKYDYASSPCPFKSFLNLFLCVVYQLLIMFTLGGELKNVALPIESKIKQGLKEL